MSIEIFRPITSLAGNQRSVPQPGFIVSTMPRSSIVMIPSTAVSTMPRNRAAVSRRSRFELQARNRRREDVADRFQKMDVVGTENPRLFAIDAEHAEGPGAPGITTARLLATPCSRMNLGKCRALSLRTSSMMIG